MIMDTLSWKRLADKKEKEWRVVLEARIEAQECQLKEKDRELQTQKEQFEELKDHFKYNLKLLEERDRELEKYDVIYSELRTKLNEKTAEFSELKIHLDDLKNVITREEKTKEELQANYQRRLREKQAEVDQYKSSKDHEVHDEREEYEQFRRTLQLQLTSVHIELDTQKTELTTEFDNELKKREHEFRVQRDELNTKVLEHDLKAKLFEKELELIREVNDNTSAQAQDAETSHRELEKLLKQKEWELADVSAVKDSQISELESKLCTSEANMKKMQEDFQQKYVEMDRMAREREETLERAKTGYLSREATLQAVVQELRSKLEDAQIKERQLIWTQQDLVQDKDMQIETLREEVSDVKERWNRHVAEMSRDNVSHDLELGTALEEQRRLRIELAQRKDDLVRYKNELRQAADREESLDKAKTQTELDWQRRCEDLERQQYDNAEDLIKSLTTARNEAQALVKERERELQHRVLLIKSLHRERDQLRTVLKKHDIPLDNFVKYSLEEAEYKEEEMSYVEDLQNQNANLRQLIAQMTRQMESLGQETPRTDNITISGEDIVFQEDLEYLRKENRELHEKLRSSRRVQFPNPAPSQVESQNILSQVEGNVGVKKHIVALNETIGALRSDKVELAASLMKQQARLAHLENTLEDMAKQPRQKQLQIDQLSYELGSHKRRHEGEVTGLKNRVTELELQLSEARREADEYHRASLERNQELVALGNQLSALKMEAAEANPSINFGAQELYIQQLQGELSQLRKRAMSLNDRDPASSRLASVGEGADPEELKYKLKSAVAKIVQLARENQQLMESNNKLRAAVNKQSQEKYSNVTQKDKADRKRQGEIKDVAFSRLSQLEQLQYQLTRQELQYASRFQPRLATTTGSTQSDMDKIITLPERDNEGHRKSPAFSNRVDSHRDGVDPKMLMSMSSGGGDSIQKVWQMLDESVTSLDHLSSLPSPRAVLAESDKAKGTTRTDDGDNFHITGQPASAAVKPVKKSSSRSAGEKYVGHVRKLAKPKSIVRNYNVRDDS